MGCQRTSIMVIMAGAMAGLKVTPWQMAIWKWLTPGRMQPVFFFNITMRSYMPAQNTKKPFLMMVFMQSISQYFGDPWQNVISHIPGNLTQPDLVLPFAAGPKKTLPVVRIPHGAMATTGRPRFWSTCPRPQLLRRLRVAVADGQIVRSACHGHARPGYGWG